MDGGIDGGAVVGVGVVWYNLNYADGGSIIVYEDVTVGGVDLQGQVVPHTKEKVHSGGGGGTGRGPGWGAPRSAGG